MDQDSLHYSASFLDSVPAHTNPALSFFFQNVPPLPYVIELGTKQWNNKISHHKDLFKDAIEYTMVDLEEGPDVHVVCDVHALTTVFAENSADAIWSTGLLEHLHSPWIAAKEMIEVLKPGGVFFIQTHQTYPIHGKRWDFYRFSKEGLENLFKGCSQLISCYDYPATIQAKDSLGERVPRGEVWLNTCIAGMK